MFAFINSTKEGKLLPVQGVANLSPNVNCYHLQTPQSPHPTPHHHNDKGNDNE